jgi:hypothetical protein
MCGFVYWNDGSRRVAFRGAAIAESVLASWKDAGGCLDDRDVEAWKDKIAALVERSAHRYIELVIRAMRFPRGAFTAELDDMIATEMRKELLPAGIPPELVELALEHIIAQLEEGAMRALTEIKDVDTGSGYGKAIAENVFARWRGSGQRLDEVKAPKWRAAIAAYFEGAVHRYVEFMDGAMHSTEGTSDPVSDEHFAQEIGHLLEPLGMPVALVNMLREELVAHVAEGAARALSDTTDTSKSEHSGQTQSSGAHVKADFRKND